MRLYQCWVFIGRTLVSSCEELTHWKRPWCWEGLEAGGEGDNRGWDGWMASPTRWAWVWVDSRSWWWTGRPGMLRFMRSQRVRHDWETELNWTDVAFTILRESIWFRHRRTERSIQGEGKGGIVTGRLMILTEISRNANALREKNWLIS